MSQARERETSRQLPAVSRGRLVPLHKARVVPSGLLRAEKSLAGRPDLACDSTAPRAHKFGSGSTIYSFIGNRN